MKKNSFESKNQVAIEYGNGYYIYYDLSLTDPSMISTTAPTTIYGKQMSPSTSVSLYPSGWLRSLPKGMQVSTQRNDVPVTRKYPELCAKIKSYIDSGRMDRAKLKSIFDKAQTNKVQKR